MPIQFEELTLEKLETFMLRFAGERRTGQLKIQGEGARGGRIDLHEGKVVGVESPFVSETLGEIAKKLGFLPMADMQRAVDALSRSENAGKQLAEILLEEKLLTEQSLETCLRYQAESAIHSMIGFHGRISFLPGNVSRASIALDTAEVLKRMHERGHIEEMGSVFLGMMENGAQEGARGADADAAVFQAQAEMRRIAQSVIREAALAAESMQADLDQQAQAAAQALLADAIAPPAPHEPEPMLDLTGSELIDALPAAADEVAKEAAANRPMLARVVLDICRPGASSTDALLGYAVHFGKRAILFAATSKGMRVAGAKTTEGEAFPGETNGLILAKETAEGAVGKVMEERRPARGPFEPADDCDRALHAAVHPIPKGDTFIFPIALHERAIGMLYVDGVPTGDPGLVEGLAAAVAATAVVMENKLVTRTAGKK